MWLESLQEPPNVLMIAHDEQLDHIASPAKEDSLRAGDADFPDTGLEHLEAYTEGALAPSEENCELFEGLVDTTLLRRIETMIGAGERGGAEIPH